MVVNITLNKEPLDYVMVQIYNSDITEGMLDKQRVVFTPSNWMNNQQIIVTGVDDMDLDGDQSYEISFSPAQSSDMNYANIVMPVINLVNIDNEVPVVNVDIKMEKNLVTVAPYNLGDSIVYELIISNLGSDDATNITISDNMTNLSLISQQGGGCLPLNQFPCVIASIQANSSKTITVIAEINLAGIFDNIASATIVEQDLDSSNNSDATNNGGITEGLSPDLGLTINECETNYSENEYFTYQMYVQNNGDVNVENALLTTNFSQNIDSVVWSCESVNGGACSTPNGTGDIHESVTLQINNSLKYTISGHINGSLNDSMTFDSVILLPAGVVDVNSNNNTINLSYTISDLLFRNGFEALNAGCN